MSAMLESEPNARVALEDKRLWVLSQQRHLIVHRRGVVDARYVDATGVVSQVGERLVVVPDYLESQLKVVVDVGCALLLAASKRAT